MVRLKDITGKAVSGEWGNDDISGNGVPVLRTTNFTMEGAIDFTKVVTRRVQKDVTEKLLRPGDILLEKSGGSDKQPVGRVVFYDGPEGIYLFNNFTALLRVQAPSRWNPKYVFYALQSNYERGGTRPYENRTTGIHNLKTEQYVADTVIPERPFAEQERITTALDTLNGLIHLRKRQLAKLDELVKARFVELFGDPIENPNEWETAFLSELGSLKNGMNFHDDDSGVELYCVGVGDFQDRYQIADTSVLRKISLNKFPSDEYLLQDGDILFVRSNGNKNLVGRSVAVYPGNIPITFSGFCIRFRNTSNGILIPYLQFLLKAESVKARLTGRGVNIQNLNQKILANLPVPLPDLNLQERFAAFARQSGQAKLAIQRGADKLQTLRAALMREYFAPDNS